MQVHTLDDRLGFSPENHDHPVDWRDLEGQHHMLQERSAPESRELHGRTKPAALTGGENQAADQGARRPADPVAMGFTVAGGRIVEIDILADPEHLSQLDLAVLDD